MQAEVIISGLALTVSIITFLVSNSRDNKQAKKDYVDTLKKELDLHSSRIEKLEWLLKQCEAEREALRKEHYHALMEIAKLEQELVKLKHT